MLLVYAGFFGFIFILSGWWSWQLAAIFFVVTELASMIALLANAAMGTQSATTWLRSVWLGAEINARNAKLIKAVMLSTLVVYLAYPIAVGVTYFRHPLFSRSAQGSIVEYSLLLLVLGSYPFSMTSMIGLLSSKDLDEGTRHSIFINQISGSVPTALLVAVGFWVFRSGAAGFDLSIPGLSQSLSTRAVILIFLFLACTILVPYLLGAQRARRQRKDFLKQRSEYLDALGDILESPTRAFYVTKLTSLSAEIAKSRTTLINSDSALVTKQQIDGGAKLSGIEVLLASAMSKTGYLDERFKFVEALERLETEIGEIVQDLQQRAPATLERAAEKWSRKFKTRKADLDQQINAGTAGKALITVGINTAATTVVSGVLSLVGKAASGIFMQHGIK